MAEENNPIIDLSQTDNDDILSLEEELLGAKPTTGSAGTVATASAKKPVATESKFHIPKFVRDEHPYLIPLILNTESMDDDEREYWFQILPIMTTDQIAKFKDILVTEKQQLEKLDREYETELSKINEKHLREWQEFESKQARDERQKREEAHEEEETSAEEELLKKLQDL